MLLVKLLAVANQVLHQLIHLSKGGGVDGGELLRRSLERGQHLLEAPCLSVCPQLLADPSVHLGSQDSFGVFCFNISTAHCLSGVPRLKKKVHSKLQSH